MNYYLSKFMTYHEVHKLYREGNSIRKISDYLGLNWRTVKKLLQKDDVSYQRELEAPSTKASILDPYREFVQNRLQQYTDTSSAQMHDLLREHYLDFPIVNAKTVFNFVQRVRRECNIPKIASRRDYNLVDELLYGQQGQVDFGFYNLITPQNKRKRVQFFTFILSRSRYKFILFSEVPFTTAMLIDAHEAAFNFIGGRPKEIVYDQDRLMMVSENYGDLILTAEFSNYVRQRGVKLYFCRKSDPESKGKVENVVNYVKRNFLYGRTYKGLETLQDEGIAWLHRTANGLVHGTTKLIPADELTIEKSWLEPCPPIAPVVTKLPQYAVHKDNKVSYRGNFYSVPSGTYNAKITKVNLQEEEGKLHILTLGNILLCTHTVCTQKGKKIIDRNHGRDMSSRIEELIQEVCELFEDKQKARTWIETIKENKRRYIRDQVKLITSSVNSNTTEHVTLALNYVYEHNIHSAVDFTAYLLYLKTGQNKQEATDAKIIRLNPLNGIKHSQLDIEPEQSDLTYYQVLFENK